MRIVIDRRLWLHHVGNTLDIASVTRQAVDRGMDFYLLIRPRVVFHSMLSILIRAFGSWIVC